MLPLELDIAGLRCPRPGRSAADAINVGVSSISVAGAFTPALAAPGGHKQRTARELRGALVVMVAAGSAVD